MEKNENNKSGLRVLTVKGKTCKTLLINVRNYQPQTFCGRSFCSKFVFIIMAYNRRNYLKNVSYIVAIYNEVKQHDIPDTHILRHEFPKHGIFISYRTWMNIKNLSASEIQSGPF